MLSVVRTIGFVVLHEKPSYRWNRVGGLRMPRPQVGKKRGHHLVHTLTIDKYHITLTLETLAPGTTTLSTAV